MGGIQLNDRIQNLNRLIDHLIDHSTPERPAWNIESQLEQKAPCWNYIDGCMIKAILDLHDATGIQKYFDFAHNFMDYFIDASGQIQGYCMEDFNCDSINGGKSILSIYRKTNQPKYKKALFHLYQQLEQQPKTSTGNFWHKNIYPNQIWLDGLYMVQPFFMEMDALFYHNRHYRNIYTQFETVHRLMQDPKTKLLYHGYDASRQSFWCDPQTGLSPNFWTRSIGWYAMALADTIEQLDEQFFYEYRKLISFFKEIIDALLPFADAQTKLFYQVTDQGNQPGNYLETSGSCAIAYCLLKGSRLSYLPTYYTQYGIDLFDGILSHKLHADDQGTPCLQDICLVAGLGGMPGKGSYKRRDGSFSYYISEPRVSNDAKGVAPLLFSYAEMLRGQHLI